MILHKIHKKIERNLIIKNLSIFILLFLKKVLLLFQNEHNEN